MLQVVVFVAVLLIINVPIRHLDAEIMGLVPHARTITTVPAALPSVQEVLA